MLMKSGPVKSSRSVCRPLSNKNIQLGKSFLGKRCRLNFERLFMEIPAREYFGEVYSQVHEDWYAEPEFCGHYLDVAMEFYDTTGREDILHLAGELVDSILAHQREDGYLGTYKPGLEFGRSFSVWNQQFTIMGLLSYYERTKNQAALEGAMKCADYIAQHYIETGGGDLVKCINYGIQHSCILIQYVRLFLLTGEDLYRDFIDLVFRTWEEANLRLLDTADPGFSSMYELSCQKGIEMLICFQGIAEMYRATGETHFLDACRNYWDFIQNTQIGLTGNGTLSELWTPAGNQFRHVSCDCRPNENCVAVGWMMFSSLLFELTGESKYFDAYERTLYNHLLGAQAQDGRDFSYYQGTYGYKVHEKKPGQYSCCRYRGLRVLAHLPRYVFMVGDGVLYWNHFCAAEAQLRIGGVKVVLSQQTDFPRSGEVELEIQVAETTAFELRIRWPAWCDRLTVQVDGQEFGLDNEEGFFRISREWSEGRHLLRVHLHFPLKLETAKVDGIDSAALIYGPLLLALDSRYQPIDQVSLQTNDLGEFVPMQDEGEDSLIVFEAKGIRDGEPLPLRFIDYVHAGSASPGADRFRVWVPVAEKGSS